VVDIDVDEAREGGRCRDSVSGVVALGQPVQKVGKCRSSVGLGSTLHWAKNGPDLTEIAVQGEAGVVELILTMRGMMSPRWAGKGLRRQTMPMDYKGHH